MLSFSCDISFLFFFFFFYVWLQYLFLCWEIFSIILFSCLCCLLLYKCCDNDCPLAAITIFLFTMHLMLGVVYDQNRKYRDLNLILGYATKLVRK